MGSSLRYGFAFAVLAVAWGCSSFASSDDAPGNGDAGVLSEAGAADAPAAVPDAAAPSFCAAYGADAAVCDEFERRPGDLSPWTQQPTGGGELLLVADAGVGGSGGLRATTFPPGDGGVVFANLLYAGGTATTSIDCELKVRVESVVSPMTLSGPLLIAFETSSPSPSAYVGVEVDQTGALHSHSKVAAAADQGKAVAKLATDKWTQVRIAIDLTVQPPKAHFFVDGVAVDSHDLAGFVNQSFSVRAGAHYVTSTSGGTVTLVVDDARVTWQ